ncbi:zinc-binding dehydrogenase [Cohnella sp. CFH 77786]|nr:zinc-binding dehydrogenase [Cohnella sp. CFH 77786]
MFGQGKLRIHVRQTFLLDRAAAAHREVESGHGRCNTPEKPG